jgi:hypothetical protein
MPSRLVISFQVFPLLQVMVRKVQLELEALTTQLHLQLQLQANLEALALKI